MSVQPDVHIISLIHPPPSLANASRSIFTPCEESDSRMVLISRERRVERVVTARSPSGMVCSTRHLNFRHDAVSLAGLALCTDCLFVPT